MCINVYMYTSGHVCVSVYTCICSVCFCENLYICMCMCICEYMCVSECVCMGTCVCACNSFCFVSYTPKCHKCDSYYRIKVFTFGMISEHYNQIFAPCWMEEIKLQNKWSGLYIWLTIFYLLTAPIESDAVFFSCSYIS